MEGLLGISWLWWALGTFGITGTILLAIFAPTILFSVGRFLLALLRAMVRTRVGVAILVAAVVFVGADIHRSRLDQKELEQQKAEFEAKQKQRDATIAADTQKAVEAALAKQTADNAAIDKEVGDFKHDLPPIPATGNSFAVGSDACKLRSIAGLPCSEPQGPLNPMPAPKPARKGAKHK